MGYGDELLASGHAQRVHDETGQRVLICDRHGEPRWSELWTGNPVIAHPGEARLGKALTRIRDANGCRPYIQYPFTRETGWNFTPGWRAQDNRGRVYFSAEELSEAKAIRARVGPFVLIEPDLKSSATQNKRWPFDRWQSVVRTLPGVTFVRLMHTSDARPLVGAVQIPSTSFRHALAILSVARAYLGPEGGLHHGAAAIGVPAAVVYGAVLSPDLMGYPEQKPVTAPGFSTCGRHLPCDHCARAMDAITVAQVREALLEALGVKRRRGRPREWDSSLTVRLPADLHDDVCAEATKREIDVSAVVRERLSARPFRNPKLGPATDGP